MTVSNANETGNKNEANLSRRDWILLPMIGLMTVCLIVICTKLTEGWAFSVSKTGLESCMVINDPSTGVRGVPNSVCREKIAEGRPVEYRLNNCGHRAGMQCGPKPVDTYRIVMAGSSIALGQGVPREESFAATLPRKLSLLTGRRVELYNEAMGAETPHRIALRFNDFLVVQPDMILWIVSPYDIEKASQVLPGDDDPRAAPNAAQTGTLARAHYFLEKTLASDSFPDAVRDIWQRGVSEFGTWPSALVLRHFLFASQSQYVKSFLMGPEADFLRAELNAEWKKRLRQTDRYTADIEAQARAANVPLVVVLLPYRAQAAMISMGQWPNGFDPYKLDNELHSIVSSRGGTYIDILPDFRDIPNPEQYYFPVDGHPNAQGHSIISGMLAKELTSGAVPALKLAAQPPFGGEQSR